MADDAVNEAQWAHAKALYMEFRSIKDIAKATGLRFYDIRKKAYGDGGCTRPSTDSWFYERLDTNREEFQELGARNLWLAQQITQKALFESFESLKLLAKRKNKKTGEKVPFKPFEIKQLTDSIATLARLLRLEQGLPTDILSVQEDPVELARPAEHTEVLLDMNKVAEALRLDPAMRKLIGASDGKGTQQEADSPEQRAGVSSGSGADPVGAMGHNRQADLDEHIGQEGVGVSGQGQPGGSGVEGSTASGAATAGGSSSNAGAQERNVRKHARSDSQDRAGNESRSPQHGEDEARDSDPGGETGVGDVHGPFADEYDW